MRSLTLLTLLVVATPLWSAPIIIDDFVEGASYIEAGRSVIDPDTGKPVESSGDFQSDLNSVYGGSRGVGIQDVNLLLPLNSNEGLISVEVSPEKGELSIVGNQRAEHTAVQYGGLFDHQLALDLTSQTDFVIDVLRYNEGELDGGNSRFAVTLHSSPDVSHRVLVDIPPSFSGGLLSIPLDEFSLVDRSSIDLVNVDYWPHPFDYSMAIDQIRIVPEPSFLRVCLFALCFLPLLRRRP